MKTLRAVVIMGLFLGIAGSLQAQMQMPKPAPELKKLNYFVGSWKLDGDVKPNPMGPGGRMTMTEEIRWMQGDFFAVSHSKFQGAGMGEGSGISVMGYNADDKVYTYDEFNSMGEATHSTGTVNGDTWTWLGQDKMGKGRFIMTITSPTTYTFKYDMSQDGTNWTTIMDGKAMKVK